MPTYQIRWSATTFIWLDCCPVPHFYVENVVCLPNTQNVALKVQVVLMATSGVLLPPLLLLLHLQVVFPPCILPAAMDSCFGQSSSTATCDCPETFLHSITLGVTVQKPSCTALLWVWQQYLLTCICETDAAHAIVIICLLLKHVHSPMVVAMSCTADVLVVLQMTMTMVMGAAITHSTTEDTMVMTVASSTAMEEVMLLLPLLLLEEAHLLLQPLPLAENC